MSSDLLARRRRDLAWWNSQAEEVTRHRRGMRWVAIIGLPLALAGALVHPLVGSAILALTVLLGLMGLYMTTVRQYEFHGHAASAREEIAALESQARGEAGPASERPSGDV